MPPGSREMSPGRAMAISFLIGIIASASYFAYHAPGALETEMEREYGWTPAQLGLLFTAYSIPPFWMTAIAGSLISTCGLKAVGAVLLSLIVVGSAIGALASSSSLSSTGKLYAWFLGRLAVGAGGEALVTWQQSACTIWFRGEHIGKSMGTALSVQQVIGSATSFVLLPLFDTLTQAVWGATAFCFGCLLCLGLYVLVERAHRPYLEAKQRADADDDEEAYEALPGEEAPGGPVVVSPWQIARAMPALFWAQNVVIFLDVTVLYSSANFFPAWLQEVHGMSVRDAGACTSLVYWMVGLAPLAGMATDRMGQRLTLQIVAGASVGAMFTLLYLAPPGFISPWLAMMLIGAFFSSVEYNAYCLLGATWRDVQGDPEGIGFGIMGIALNLGLVSLPELTGLLATATGTTRHQNLLFAAWMFAGTAVSVLERYLPGGDRLNDVAEAPFVPVPRLPTPSASRSSMGSSPRRASLLSPASSRSPAFSRSPMRRCGREL